MDDERIERIVAIGASAGGVEALRGLAAALPSALPAAVLVVLHMPVGGVSALAAILSRAGRLPAVTAESGQLLRPGHIYVASPNHHLLVSDDRAVLSTGPTENGHRPSIDALFRSVAISAGRRAVGVLLSGVLDDGSAGMWAIARRGGTTVVQSPEEAIYPAMPRNAMRAVDIDHVLPVAGIAELLDELAGKPVEQTDDRTPAELVAEAQADAEAAMNLENRIARGEQVFDPGDSGELGPMSGYVCPDCNGSLMRIGPHRYRCRVGHAWTADALLEAQDTNFEGALWAALRSLDEKVSLARRMATQQADTRAIASRYVRMAEEAAHAAGTLRAYLRDAGKRGESTPLAAEE